MVEVGLFGICGGGVMVVLRLLLDPLLFETCEVWGTEIWFF